MPNHPKPADLSRRERQIMDVIYRLGSATAAQVHAALGDAPADTTVRKLIRVLEQKQHVTHRTQGTEYVYSPRFPKHLARKQAIHHLVETFFDGSVPRALTALLGASDARLTPEDRDALMALIKQSEKGGR